MFISLSKSFGKVGGFRIGIGKRVTSKNAWWLALIVFFVAIFQLMWYMMVFCFWLMYAMCYGLWWCIKKPVQGLIILIKKTLSKKAEIKKLGKSVASGFTSDSAENANEPVAEEVNKISFCPYCGVKLEEGNAFCTNCGKQIQ